jgi:hypothetical protein
MQMRDGEEACDEESRELIGLADVARWPESVFARQDEQRSNLEPLPLAQGEEQRRDAADEQASKHGMGHRCGTPALGRKPADPGCKAGADEIKCRQPCVAGKAYKAKNSLNHGDAGDGEEPDREPRQTEPVPTHAGHHDGTGEQTGDGHPKLAMER